MNAGEGKGGEEHHQQTLARASIRISVHIKIYKTCIFF